MSDDFISNITKETLAICGASSDDVGHQDRNQLENYFENKNAFVKTILDKGKLLSFLDENQILVLQGEYLFQIQSIRFLLGEEVIDFPTFWSYFKVAKQMKGERFISFSQENDPDFLYLVISPLIPQVGKIIFYFKDDKIFLVVIKEAEKSYDLVITDYFDKYASDVILLDSVDIRSAG